MRFNGVDYLQEVKNPITVARLVLDASTQPLSLQRVPPNLLVGPGATEFAADHGVSILPHDYLISEGARARWVGWKKDLVAAETQATNQDVSEPLPDPPTYHIKPESSTPASSAHSPSLLISPDHPLSRHLDPQNVSRCALPISACLVPSSQNGHRMYEHNDDGDESGTDDNLAAMAMAHYPSVKRQRVDGSQEKRDVHALHQAIQLADGVQPSNEPDDCGQDRIVDTVGAIAVDCYGRIAAGSSSGGIGMKHRGRVGPAALVGIGTAVIPANPDDPDKASVATVTSGTGEHMATTAAAQTAADRIHACVRKRRGTLESCDEDEAMYSMIKNDFMKHPGVSNSPCTGAIGVLCVKKTRRGIYFYFAHNTDSFAIASMHSNERQPVCVMSRNKGNGSIAQGARRGRVNRTSKHSH